MSLVDFIVSLLLIAAALWLCWFFGRIVLRQVLVFSSNSKGSPRRDSSSKDKGTPGKSGFDKSSKAKKLAAKIEQIESSLAAGNTEKAIKDLKKALILDHRPNGEDLAFLHHHNEVVLSLFLQTAENRNRRIPNLKLVEQLLEERSVLDLELLKAEASYKKVIGKRERSGKDTPNWGKKEFKHKVAKAKEARKDNLNYLKKELKRLFASLENGDDKPASEEVTYH